MGSLFALRGVSGRAVFAPAVPPPPVISPTMPVVVPGTVMLATTELIASKAAVRTDVSIPATRLVAAASIIPGDGAGGTAATQLGYSGPRSKARTLVVYPASTPFVLAADEEVGTFWNVSNPEKPKGIKDPQSVIDVSVDWTPVLLDAADQYQMHVVKMTGGLVLVATGHVEGVTTMFVAGGAIGKTATITVQIRSSSSPARVYERTLYLKIKSL